MHQIVVFGFYSKNNLGDTLFQDAFKFLFPQLNFIFLDHFIEEDVNKASTIFIGGGSFLFSDFGLTDKNIELLKTKNIFYIGVGSETDIHSVHLDLFNVAKLIALRNNHKFEEIKQLNNNTIIIDDLVYCLPANKIINNNKKVLILPNISVVPSYNDPSWMHLSWEYFKSEFAQFLDYVIEQDYNIKFLAFCQNRKIHDHGDRKSVV
jgi:hypothetical protein